jgi:hypothetical protein
MDDELRKKLAARLKIQEQDPPGSAPSHAGGDSSAVGGSATTPGRLKIPQGINPGRFNPALGAGIPTPFGMVGRPSSMGSSQAAKGSSVSCDFGVKIKRILNKEKWSGLRRPRQEKLIHHKKEMLQGAATSKRISVTNLHIAELFFLEVWVGNVQATLHNSSLDTFS